TTTVLEPYGRRWAFVKPAEARFRNLHVLLLADSLAASDSTPGLAGDLRHDAFAEVLGNVLEQSVVRLLQLRIAVNLLHQSLAGPMLAFELLQLVEDKRALEALTRHGLDKGKVTGILTDECIDSG